MPRPQDIRVIDLMLEIPTGKAGMGMKQARARMPVHPKQNCRHRLPRNPMTVTRRLMLIRQALKKSLRYKVLLKCRSRPSRQVRLKRDVKSNWISVHHPG